MWYDTRGQGDPLVALHPGGAGVDSRALAPNVAALARHFRVYTPEQRGHGHTPDVAGPITFELMAQDTIAFIETVIGGPVYLLGCSDGASLALPDFLRQGYGEVSPDGIGHYDVIVAKLDAMHAHEPALTHDDLGTIACRTLVMVADDDEVRLEHAVDLYRNLPDAELSVVPGTSHGLLVEKPELCNTVITEFFTKDPAPTFAPIRRAGSR